MIDPDNVIAMIDSAAHNALDRNCRGCTEVPDPCKFHKEILRLGKECIVRLMEENVQLREALTNAD